MKSRVGRVAVALRLAEQDRGLVDGVRRTLEHVVIQGALDELERTLHARYGASTIVRIRSLATRWRLGFESLEDPLLASELAGDLVASVVAEIEQLPHARRLRPLAEANAVMFADESHAVAAELADRCDGRTAWFHPAPLPAAATWAAVLARGSSFVAAVELWLERMEIRSAVASWIQRADPAVRATLPDRAATAPAHPDAEVRAVPRLAELAPAARTIAAPPAAVRVDMAVGDDEVRASVLESSIAPIDGVATQLAGLWYFARLVMELEMAEQLWAVGVAEGDFLVQVARALADTDDDPSVRWFGGAWDREPRIEAAPAWALKELEDGRAVALARAAPGVSALDPACFDADDVVARCAAALVTVFCARLGCAPDLARARSYLRLRGRLELGDTLRVILAMDAIDVDLRRAGLDLDPGYLPWMSRKVELVFE